MWFFYLWRVPTFLHVNFLLVGFLPVNFLLVDVLLVESRLFTCEMFVFFYLWNGQTCFTCGLFYLFTTVDFDDLPVFHSSTKAGSTMRVLNGASRVYVGNVGFKRTKWEPRRWFWYTCVAHRNSFKTGVVSWKKSCNSMFFRKSDSSSNTTPWTRTWRISNWCGRKRVLIRVSTCALSISPGCFSSECQLVPIHVSTLHGVV